MTTQRILTNPDYWSRLPAIQVNGQSINNAHKIFTVRQLYEKGLRIQQAALHIRHSKESKQNISWKYYKNKEYRLESWR